jgi:hypothetical protein
MLLGALIPGSGVAVEATFDISTELAIDMIIDSDLSEDLVENSVDFAQGVVEGEAFDKATGKVKAQAAIGVIAPYNSKSLRFQRVSAKKTRVRGENLESDDEAAVVSLKEYRKSIEIRSKIIARRQGHPCYFDMIVRRDNSSNFRDDVVAVASRLTLRELCKINSRERAMLEMFDEFADDVSETEDAETYDETFDAEFSKCRAERKKLATRRETII